MLHRRRIDGYLLRELASPTILGLLLYTFALLMNHFFIVAEQALSKGLSAELTLRLFAIGIPRLLVLSLPMAVLLGTLIALGRLSADHEWVALQAAGHGPGTLLRPVLVHGLLGMAASLFIYSVLVPQTHYAFRNLRGRILFSSNLAADLKPRVFYDLPDDSVLFVDEISPGNRRRLEGVLLIQNEPDKVTTNLVRARFGDLYPAPDGSGALIVDLDDGEARSYRSDDPDVYRLTRFHSAEGRRIEPPAFVRSLLAPPEKVVQDLGFGELWHEMNEARREARKIVAEPKPTKGRGHVVVAQRRSALATVEFHQRLALPVASLLFAFLALPLGITNVRSGKGAGFAMSLIVILIYRLIFVVTRNQSLAGTIPAAIGPWIADALILVWGIVAYRRLHRSAGRTSRLADVFGVLGTHLRRRPDPAGGTASAGWGWWAIGGVLLGVWLWLSVWALGGVLLGATVWLLCFARIDRYLALAYLRVLALALASAYLVFGLVELQGLMDDLVRSNQPPALVLRYFQYFAPTVFHVVLPIACLVAAVVAITVLARTGELVAIKASGVGMRRATVPLLLLTLALCGLLFVVQDRLAPPAQRKAQTVRDQIEGRTPRSHGAPLNGRWTFGADGRTLYHYRQYLPAKQEFQGLSVFTLDRSGPTVVDHRFADRARWTGDRWVVGNGWYRSFAPERYERYTDEQELRLDAPGAIVSEDSRLTAATGNLPDEMSLAELSEQIRALRNSGYDITDLRVRYHGKFSHAAAPLVMVLLGLPFAFRVGRRGSLYGIGVALILVLVYWATFAIFNALGLETLLPPVVAAWAPNALFGLVGLYLMLYVPS